MAFSPAPSEASALPERSNLDRDLIEADLNRLARSLASLLHPRLPLPLRATSSPASLAPLVASTLLGLLDAPDAELVPAIDAIAVELGAWRRFRSAVPPDELASVLSPLGARVL